VTWLHRLASQDLHKNEKEREKKFTWFSFENNSWWIIHERSKIDTCKQRLHTKTFRCDMFITTYIQRQIYTWFFTIIQNNSIRVGIMCKTCKCHFQKLSIIIIIIKFYVQSHIKTNLLSRANRVNHLKVLSVVRCVVWPLATRTVILNDALPV